MDKYVNDPFMNRERVKDRLRNEFKKYGKLIIAYDFDYTVHNFHDEGYSYEFVSNLLRRWRPYANFIVFTASPESRFQYIKENICDIFDIHYSQENSKKYRHIIENVKRYVEKMLED